MKKHHGMEVLQASPGKTLPAASGQLLRREAPATCQPCVQMGCPGPGSQGGLWPCQTMHTKPGSESPSKSLLVWWKPLLEESTPKRVPSVCGVAKRTTTHVPVPT